MNRRFFAALFVLVLSGTAGAVSLLQAQQEDSGLLKPNHGPKTRPASQRDLALPPLPDAAGQGGYAAMASGAGGVESERQAESVQHSREAPPNIKRLPWQVSAKQSTASANAGTPAQQILLLRNGGVIPGKVEAEGDRYRVAAGGGEIFVKKSDVEFIGASLNECYEHRRSQIEPGSVDRRLELATWCVGQSLFDEAAAELAEARHVDARHPRIPLIARQIELARKAAERSLSATPKEPGVAATFQRMDALANKLPKGTVETFTTQVQPLLLNSCAATGCHVRGASASIFEITRFSRSQGANSRLTQRNLRAVLRYVDSDAVDQSPLLTMALTAHGGSSRPPIASADSSTFESLARWVIQTVDSNPHGSTSGLQQAFDEAAGMSSRDAGNSLLANGVRPLPPQQPVVRTADEIRALLTGHSFVDAYDKRKAAEEELKQQSRSFEDGNAVGDGNFPNAGVNANSSQYPQDVQARAARNGITLEEQLLLDSVSDIQLENEADIERRAAALEFTPTPARVRVGAADQNTHSEEFHHAELDGFRPRDPFDPDVFNRQFATRPPASADAPRPAPRGLGPGPVPNH